MNYELVDTENEFKDIEMIASITWPIAYKDMISSEQIKYMLNKYLSVESIKENVKNGYTYLLVLDERNAPIGFAAYRIESHRVFLSKLYLLPNEQNKGYAREIITFLKSYKLPIELTVNKHNKPAYEKYIHMGFKVIDSVVTDIGNGFVMDDYVMQLKEKK